MHEYALGKTFMVLIYTHGVVITPRTISYTQNDKHDCHSNRNSEPNGGGVDPGVSRTDSQPQGLRAIPARDP